MRNSVACFFLSRNNYMRSFTGFDVTKKFKIINKKCGNSGRLLLLEIDIDDCLFVLINIYNANNEPDQIKTLHDLGEISDCVGNIQNESIISTQ